MRALGSVLAIMWATATATAASAQTPAPAIVAPAAIVADGVPAIPAEIRAASLPYMEFRQASFVDWNPRDRSMLIATRFGNTNQLHRVAGPGMDRTQLTFEDEPVVDAAYAPARGDALVVSKDVGGNEFNQLHRLENGRLVLLTDGKAKNDSLLWSHDGARAAYTSTRRTGADTDFYVIDPRDKASDRMVAQVKGGGWFPLDFARDGGRLLVGEYISINESRIHEIDLASGAMRRVTPEAAEKVAYGAAVYGADGVIWATSDVGSDFQRLGTLDPRTGAFTALALEPKWDVETIDISQDGRTIAYVVNEAGASRLKLLDTRTRRARAIALPAGVISSIGFAPWGELGLTLSSARSPADAYSVTAAGEVRRWTTSETGGVDASKFVEPELVSVRSFDGEEVSGFLYRPDAARFAGKRPLIVNIHGGPEGQSRPGYLGRNNYLVNELGLAVFYPNVRGSSGFGKRFVALDNGVKREDSVKDIGAFLDRLAADPRIDPARIAVTGGSYGGYMTYASAQMYADRIKAALSIVGISDFTTFLTNTESYRRDLRRVEYGDERDPAIRAVFDRISPLRNVARIKDPLMVVTGGNDPRVPASEADQLVKAVRGGGGTAWHVLARDEGHGFAKKANADYQFWASVAFWRRYLLEEEAPSPPA